MIPAPVFMARRKRAGMEYRTPPGRCMHKGGKTQRRARCMVPAEGLEPPTFGLQNHCSTN